jgi:hypothetical protein
MYRRLRARLGPAQATVATAHAIARVVYKMLKYKACPEQGRRVEYDPLSVNEYQKKYDEQQVKYMKKTCAEPVEARQPNSAANWSRRKGGKAYAPCSASVDKTPVLHLIPHKIFDDFMASSGSAQSFSKKNTPNDDIWGALERTVSKDAVLAPFCFAKNYANFFTLNSK